MKGQQEAPGRPRIKVSPARFTGRIEDWKGTFGWIQPEAPINHPEAAMKRGKVYLNQVDVEAEIAGVGSRVSFFVYADGSGLGAMNCRPAESPAIIKTVTKATLPPQFAGCKGKGAPAAAAGKGAFAAPGGLGQLAKAAAFAPPAKGQGKGKDPGVRTRVGSAKVAGKMKSWTGNFGWVIPLEQVSHPQFRGQLYLHKNDVESPELLQAGTQVEFFTYSDAQGLGAEECTLSDAVVQDAVVADSPGADVAAGGAAEGGQDKDTSRERLTAVPTTGEVIEWRGSFGWIRAHETVDHPLAAKRQGKVYVSRKDLSGQTSLQAGQLVQFHVFADASGVGAEECMPF